MDDDLNFFLSLFSSYRAVREAPSRVRVLAGALGGFVHGGDDDLACRGHDNLVFFGQKPTPPKRKRKK